MPRRIRVHLQSLPGDPALDTAVSRALLRRVGDGRAGESFRLHRPDDVVAFSPLDAAKPGFEGAVRAARAEGFAAVRRLAGGRAAVFHTETLAFAWCVPSQTPRAEIRARFDSMANLSARALIRLGVDARVGEVPGEYCPGAHSVNARGRTKLMGVGQRLVRGAAHVGGVFVVRDSERVRRVLVPVYRALGLSWDPATVGSVEEEIGPVTREEVAGALLEELGRESELIETEFEPELLDEARILAPEHRA
jgi:lipoate-protein ligase A